MCMSVHGGVVGDSADRCVMTAYHCRGAGARVAVGGLFLACVFSTPSSALLG